MSGHSIPLEVIADTLATLQGINAEPQILSFDAHLDLTHVKVAFLSLADLEAWCRVDKAKVEKVSKPHLCHDEHSALYDRPGRRALAVFRDWYFPAGRRA